MKKLTCLVLLNCISGLLSGQDQTQYRILADYCYDINSACESVVIAPSGLKLRTKPGFSAKTIALIPFGEKVRHTGVDQTALAEPVYDADSIPGTWKKVSWDRKEGYVFSAYLGQGIMKMDKPFYLLDENGAWCWDDSYISADYHYYGVYANADTTVLTIKKSKPIFFNKGTSEDDLAGVSFSLQQKKPSLFAFAVKDSFPERQFRNVINNDKLAYNWISPEENNSKILIPKTNWEISFKSELISVSGQPDEKRIRLMLKDKKTGAWHYLLDDFWVEHAALLWCGDMDGDSIQDFMLKISGGHSGGMALFLSKNPGKWQFVRLVGRYFWGDCC